MLRIAYHTLGCKVNQYETEKIRQTLERAGFETSPFSKPADVYVINTCSVTHVADSKSRAAVRKAIRLNPDAYVIVAGCYAQLEPGQVSAIEGVDLVVPHDEKEAIPDRLIARFGAPRSALRSSHSPKPRLRTRAVVKVQDGCDQFCAYCIIPYARTGRTSRPVEQVLEELRSLAGFGYREVVLAGIRLGSYDDRGTCLPQLIRSAAGIDGISRIRLSSIEPWEVDDELLEAMQHPKVCRHLHIPLQSGDDGVLLRMNRPYDSSQYMRTADNVRKKIPEIGITTDVIAGFPGEDEEAFLNTCRVIEATDFSRLHVFRYSARKRTRAAAMPGQVPEEEKKQRAERLMELGTLAMARFAGSLTGQTMEVLVESEHQPSGRMTGFADNYSEVRLPGGAELKGRVVRARITGVDQDGVCTGEVLSVS